jgi:hypothetical protein
VGLAYEPNTETLYGVSRPTVEVPAPGLYAIDAETPDAQLVGPLDVASHLEGLGTMYGSLLGGYDGIYVVDPVTATTNACELMNPPGSTSLIYGMATWTHPGPDVESVSWGSVKAHY